MHSKRGNVYLSIIRMRNLLRIYTLTKVLFWDVWFLEDQKGNYDKTY